MTDSKPHLLHVVIDDRWVGFEVECPYGDDPTRPCDAVDEDGRELGGCAPALWLDEHPDPEDHMEIPRQKVTGPIAVEPTWNLSDEVWTFRPWGES